MPCFKGMGSRLNPCIRLLGLMVTMVGIGLIVASCAPQLTAEEKLADFRYLFEVLKQNHPYLALKARVENYDWLSYEKEFEKTAVKSGSEAAFARAIQEMLLLINNGHTCVMDPLTFLNIQNAPNEMVPWIYQATKTNIETVNRWYQLAIENQRYPQDISLPFRARYVNGEYLVYWASDELVDRSKVTPGQIIRTVNAMPVHEYVETLRGKTWLRYDPLNKRLFMLEFMPPYRGRPLHITFEDELRRITDVRLGFSEVSEFIQPPTFPTGVWNMPNVYTTTLADGQVGYVHISHMTGYSKSGSEKELLSSFFSEIRDLPALIIDIRNNVGGSNLFWMLNIVRPLAKEPVVGVSISAYRSGEYIMPFLCAEQSSDTVTKEYSILRTIIPRSELLTVITPSEMANLPPEVLTPDFVDPVLCKTTIYPSGEYPFDGDVFLLVDQEVFSAADCFAQFCKYSGWAKVIGQHTAGDASYSNIVLVTLPNSGMVVKFPPDMGLNPDFSASEETHTIPDIYVEQEPEALLEYAQAIQDGREFPEPDPELDTVLRKCLEMIGGSRGSRGSVLMPHK